MIDCLTLSLLRVINVEFPLQPHRRNITSHSVKNLASYLTQMKDDYTTNSHYLT